MVEIHHRHQVATTRRDLARDEASRPAHLIVDQRELAILVREDHPGAPQTWHPGGDDESGRGLQLAQALRADPERWSGRY